VTSLPSIKLKVEAKELIAALLEGGRLVQVADDIIFAPSAYEQARQRVIDFVKANGSITVAELRDLLNTSRR